jgi:lipoprotein-releasing system ATP-binding protein
MAKTVLQSEHINKYFNDPVRMQVLKSVSFSVDQGEFVAVTGKSGCGKSTLLYILSTMDTDYEGDLLIDGEKMRDKTEPELARIRNEKIGFVFQFHYLLNEFTALKNVMLPGLKLQKYDEKEVEHRAIERLKTLGIEHLALKKANQLSGGEKQRVAIARALINDPIIIMGDEPTGNLDSVNGAAIMDLIFGLQSRHGATLIMVTHAPDLAARCGRTIRLVDGRIAEDSATNPAPKAKAKVTA